MEAEQGSPESLEQPSMADAEQTKLLLLGYWACPFSQRCRIAMVEKDLAHGYRMEEMKGKMSPLLLQSNPVHKKIPVLIHDGKPICESLNIVQYLDEVWPDRAPLLPADPYARAQARFWADFIDKKVYGSGAKIWKSREPGAMEEAKKEIVEFLKLLEGELGDKKYFGVIFGFVDIALVPFIPWFRACEKFVKFSLEEEVPKLASWAKRCMEIDSVLYFVSGRLAPGISGMPACSDTWCGVRGAFLRVRVEFASYASLVHQETCLC